MFRATPKGYVFSSCCFRILPFPPVPGRPPPAAGASDSGRRIGVDHPPPFLRPHKQPGSETRKDGVRFTTPELQGLNTVRRPPGGWGLTSPDPTEDYRRAPYANMHSRVTCHFSFGK